MGVAARQRDADTELVDEIHSLLSWISQMRTKKRKYLCSRRRNIRIEAVLAHALDHAEKDVRDKQVNYESQCQERKRRRLETQKNTKNIMEVVMNTSSNETSATISNSGDDGDNDWLELFPELESLDYFMSQLNEIKEPVSR
ncbi:hypothetical protein PV327_000173 [Microctonus hyperodae]|uniref:Uncharacterized protein n=1 Tax=Microctonus hyperodae TaxID=165561 RepID=A0AA39G609_MICHY|nr:hypothetical protein PV327_000173 [Microctonus hyperodae]